MFRLDGFIMALIFGVIITVVLRTVIGKLKNYLEHVGWLKGLSGGTFIADAEADYWRRLIKQPNYRPIWRWVYGKQWATSGEKFEAGLKKRSMARKIGYANVVLVSVIVLVLLFANLNIRLVPEIRVTTEMNLQAYTVNLLLESGTKPYSLAVENASDGGWYAGEFVGFIVKIERTDAAFITKPVYLNLTSRQCVTNTTRVYCVASVSYLFYDGTNTWTENVASDSQVFSWPVDMPRGGILIVGVSIQLNSFVVGEYQEFLSFQTPSTKLGALNYLSIGGGTPCYFGLCR